MLHERMPTSLLSSLSRGYGTWTGSFDTVISNDNILPSLDPKTFPHRHGVTVTPRASTASSVLPVADDGHLDLPKTFFTRKGALMLFSAHDNLPQEPAPSPRPKQMKHQSKNIFDVSLKLKTLERLSLSVLQYGDKNYDKDAASVSGKDSNLFFNFLYNINEKNSDNYVHSQPGGDLKFYLRDLKRRIRAYGTGGSFPYRARSAELQEILDQLEQTWSELHRRESSFIGSLSGNKVLSSKKLTASLKSLNFMGRPESSEPYCNVWNENKVISTERHYGCARRTRSSVWMAESATPSQPIKMRPRTSPQSGRTESNNLSEVRRLQTSPEHRVNDSTNEVACRYVWGKDNEKESHIRDHLQSQLTEAVSEMRFVQGGEEDYTPSEIDRSGDNEVSLAETASLLSSLTEEDDLDVSVDDLTDKENEFWTDNQLPIDEGPEEMYTMTLRRKNSRKLVCGRLERTYIVEGLAKPLEAPYAGVLLQSDEKLRHDESEQVEGVDAHLQKVQKNRRECSAFSGALLRRETSTKLAGYSEPSIDQVSQVVTKMIIVPSTLSTASSDSVDRLASCSGTLISLQKDEPETGQINKLAVLESRSNEDILAESARVPDSEAQDTLAVKNKESRPIVVKVLEKSAGEKPFHKMAGAKQVLGLEKENAQPALSDSRKRSEDEQISVVEEKKEDEISQLSERVRNEREERQQKVMKLREEKETSDVKKKEVEKMRLQKLEMKKRAAEERLRQRAEEVARRKENERKKQDEELITGISEPPLKPTPPTGKKSITAPRKSTSKGGKTEKKGIKATASAETESKEFVSVQDIPSVQSEDTLMDLTTVSKLQETSPKTDVPTGRPLSCPGRPKTEADKKTMELPEHMKEMLSRKSSSQVHEELETVIDKMQSAINQTLTCNVIDIHETEGLSAEDFAVAEEALMARVKKAQEEILDRAIPKYEERPNQEAKKVVMSQVARSEKKPPAKKKKKSAEAEKKKELAKEKEAMKEERKLEKQRRLEEVKDLQEKIASKEETRKMKEAETKRKTEELAERMESVRKEEEEIERTEADAKRQLSALRKAQREERETRRKADLEHKKQEAFQKRQKSKAMLEEARQKEQETLAMLADAEIARRLREEGEARREEEELEAQEKFEAELKAAKRAAEEEEERLRELERQAEEEALHCLLKEKEEAEEKRKALEEQASKLREEEERVQSELLEEKRTLEGEKRKKMEEETAREEMEKERLRELQRLKEEAREKMQTELEKRRAWALQRREYNLNARASLDAMRQSQAITEPWTFSYFVTWPKESYMKPMGQDPKKPKTAQRLKPKPPATEPNASTEANTTDTRPVEAAVVSN